MNNHYEAAYDLALLATEIGQTLKKNHNSAALIDKVNFVSEDSRCQIDTYQVLELSSRGYITINVYFFRPKLSEEKIQVKFSIYSPGWNQSSMKIRKLQKEIDSVIRSHSKDTR